MKKLTKTVRMYEEFPFWTACSGNFGARGYNIAPCAEQEAPLAPPIPALGVVGRSNPPTGTWNPFHQHHRLSLIHISEPTRPRLI
eukprot:1175367-Amphidinium_carterae.1